MGLKEFGKRLANRADDLLTDLQEEVFVNLLQWGLAGLYVSHQGLKGVTPGPRRGRHTSANQRHKESQNRVLSTKDPKPPDPEHQFARTNLPQNNSPAT